jgi:hypothetical protein
MKKQNEYKQGFIDGQIKMAKTAMKIFTKLETQIENLQKEKIEIESQFKSLEKRFNKL